MKAKELAEILMQDPELEVFVSGDDMERPLESKDVAVTCFRYIDYLCNDHGLVIAWVL